jgi:Glyoxalase/Bleomycin resistance protein/Dioxygenase superfamily
VLDKSYFHVGIVVPRLEEALEHLSSSLGARWGGVTSSDVVVQDARGRRATVPLRLVYSVEPPYIEVIEEAPGTVWECNPYSNLHHIGFWAEGLAPSHDELVASACPLELAGVGGEQGDAGAAVPAMFTFHKGALGVRIELLDAAIRPMMEEALIAGTALGPQ